MDRGCLYGTRDFEYLKRLGEFIIQAVEPKKRHGDDEQLMCPCSVCKNRKKVNSASEMREHLILKGFKPNYTVWIWHGEKEIDIPNCPTAVNVEKQVDNIMVDFEVIGEDYNNDEVNEHSNDKECNIEADNVDQMMDDLEKYFDDCPDIFQMLVSDSKKPLFPSCSKFTRLLAVLKLYTLKAGNGWSDKSFTALLKLLTDMLPEGRKKDGKLRHVVDAPQWRTIDRDFPEFGSEPRNLRLGLCTDGINPFGTQSTQHSPKQPGNDTDVFLEPLIENLKMLWNVGVEVFDAASGSKFQMRAMLYCTINDFPAYGNLSGYRLKTDKGFPVYGDDTEAEWLEHSGKFVYMCHRRELDPSHHYQKNVFDSIIGTLLIMPNKTKDGVKARHDIVGRGRSKVNPIQKGKRTYLPPTCTTLSKIEKKVLCESLKGVKVPHGYSSNISSLVSMKDLKLVGLKSHDCHILLTQLLPIVIRSILPKHVRQFITKLCKFFNAINAKDINPDSLDDLQVDVVVTLCELQMYFPISFFDIMVHLIVHLVREIKLCGSLFQSSMWAMEREMGTYKRRMKNPYRPEGSIIEATVSSETLRFCKGYFNNMQPLGLPTSRHEGWLEGGVMTELSKISNKSSDNLRWLANGPKANISSYEGYDINGFCFYTSQQDQKSTMQNSGVTVVASSVEYVGRGIKVDEMGFMLADVNVIGHIYDPFILASQEKQVFFMKDPLENNRSVILYGKRRILGVDGVVDEEEYDQLDEPSPISTNYQNLRVIRDETYLHEDHDEGICFQIISKQARSLSCMSTLSSPVNDFGPEQKTRDVTTGKNSKEENPGNLSINFNEYGQPVGEYHAKFVIDLGLLVKNIKITYNDWRKVPLGEKETLWKEIKITWKIKDDTNKKYVVKMMSKAFREFRCTLHALPLPRP
ncbi:uncharacterized protein LOC141595481 [Silene latifolia]|uniref:uncharacterized protein LOC141595481 n=1 Tax=Silene latifolia TaxID=37657 RepID=UPI003D7887B6